MLVTRRDFIKGAAVAFLTLEGGYRLRSIGKGVEGRYVESTRDLMGTSARIGVVHSNVNRAERAMELAFEDMYRVDKLMSTFRRESEISILNKYGHYQSLSPETAYVIREAIHYSTLSDGAFDISILPMLESGERGPSDLVNYKNIILEGRSIRFLKEGMKITLGGIGIGYAVDKAIEALKQHSIEHAMVNAGGDIRSIGDKAEGISWKVGIRDPRNKEDFVSIIDLNDRSIATSANYEQVHILNPKTGVYSDELLSVTISAPKTIDADAVSTTVFVLGLKKGMEFIERLDGVEGLLITKENRVLKSKGFMDNEALLDRVKI